MEEGALASSFFGDNVKPKIIRGRLLDNLNMQIHASTAGLFADMLNPKIRGSNFRFTPQEFSEMSFSFGFYPGGYSTRDMVKRYEHENPIPIETYWKDMAFALAKRLIDGAGINEMGNWND
jgi:hypothetical protein